MKPDKEIRWDICGKCKKALAEEYLATEAAKEAGENVKQVSSMVKAPSGDVMVKIKGVSFRCTCGCNVFRVDPDYQNPDGSVRYICNSCKAWWIGEK